MRKLGEADLVSLCGAVAANSVLQELQVSGHRLTPAALAAAGAMLQANKTLQRLALGDAALGSAGLEALVAGGLLGNDSLTHLDLSFKASSSPAEEKKKKKKIR